ncbi:MAG: response regulator [Gammaproteobacteria bacterium]|nr:response regulator [Gammaproteobacteria bacterium]
MNQEISTQRVYIIDDDDAVRDAMSMLLESDSIAHRCFSSADEFFDNYSDDQRGCLVLDIRMPGMTGLELQARLQEMNSTLPIIFMTGHGDVPMAVEAMRQGAVDFMRKPISEDDLLARIHQALQQESSLRDQSQEHYRITALIESLTQRELEVFERVAKGDANKAIAIELGISERTVEVHRSQVMKKLETRNLAQLVRIWLVASTR